MRLTMRVLMSTMLTLPGTLMAQDPRADSLAVLAVADSSLAALSRGDYVAFTNWMVEGATIASVSESAQGRRVNLATREGFRARTSTNRLMERGFRGTAMVDGPIAMVWLPYDFYVNDTWSHCGVDIFTMVKSDRGWKIASLAYTVLQPPACTPHPDGPPAQHSRSGVDAAWLPELPGGLHAHRSPRTPHEQRRARPSPR